MVLATFRDHLSEQELNTLLKSFDFGTPAFHIRYLAQIGYNVEYRSFTPHELASSLAQGQFPIVILDASMLPWANFEGFHALVLLEITDQNVALHDPAQSEGSNRLLLDGFLAAWREFDDKAAIITQ